MKRIAATKLCQVILGGIPESTKVIFWGVFCLVSNFRSVACRFTWLNIVFPLYYHVSCPVLIWDLQRRPRRRIALQWLFLQLLDFPVAVGFGTTVDWRKGLAFDLKGRLALIIVLRYLGNLHRLSLVLFPLMLGTAIEHCDSPLIKIPKRLFLCLLLLQLLQTVLCLVLRVFHSLLELFDEIGLRFVGEFHVAEQCSEPIIDESRLTSGFTPSLVLVRRGRSFSDAGACLEWWPARSWGRSARLSCSPAPGCPPCRTAASSLPRSFPSPASFPNSIQYNIISLSPVCVLLINA